MLLLTLPLSPFRSLEDAAKERVEWGGLLNKYERKLNKGFEPNTVSCMR